MRILLIILLFLSQFAKAQPFYVSTTGNSGNSGSFASPWDLRTALLHPAAVDPGDTIYVLAGTYNDTVTVRLTGTALAPILVKAVGRVIIDGSLEGDVVTRINALTVRGGYTIFWGFEITNSDPDRVATFSGSDGRGDGMEIFAPGVKVINCIFYDCGNGVATWEQNIDGEFYGNVLFNNGWLDIATGDGTGHGAYIQNDTGLKTFKENIAVNNFGYGLKFYAEGGDIKNALFEGNAVFNDVFFFGGGTPLENIEINENFTYEIDTVWTGTNTVRLGFFDKENTGLTMTNNHFFSGIDLLWWHNITITNNTFFAKTVHGGPFDAPFFVRTVDEGGLPPDLSTFNIDNNIYYWPNTISPFFFWNDLTGASNTEESVTLANWNAAGQDVSSTFTQFAVVGNDMQLSGKKTFVRLNAYDNTRANVIVYNWSLTDSVKVGAGMLSAGDTYELRNALDYFGDVVSGTFAGGDSLTVPMINHTVAEPIGLDTLMGENTFPEFGTFVLIKTGNVNNTVTPVPDRGQANAVKISPNRGSGGLPHVTLGTGTGGGEEFTRDNLIINEGFEGGDPWPSGVFNLGQDNLGEDHGGGTNTWARVQVNTGANEGTSAHQIEVRSGCDGCQSQGYRSEMTFDTDVAANNTEYWYGYSQKFKTPNSGGFWTGNNSGVFIQWHPTGGSGSSTVAMSNDYNENGQGFTLWTNPGGLGDVTHSESGVDIVDDTWYHFVWNIFWGTANNGYVKVWINGVLEFNITGLDFNTEGQYMKLGMNRWSWSGPDCDASGCTTSSYPTDTWIIQYDNFRVGTSLATFNDVSPTFEEPEP